MPLRRNAAFTLVELAVVVLVLGLLAAAAFRYNAVITVNANNAAIAKKLDTIEAALQNYRNANLRLPCPTTITAAENTNAFGIEVGTAGDGNCTGADFINSGTDPDNADPNYLPASASKVVAGGVPTKTLKLDDKYAYDPWGRKILFAVDIRATAATAFTTYSISDTVIGAVVVKKNATDTLANAVTYQGLYALVSAGPNGHGGYVRNASAASTRYNAGSTNSNEQKNCHCDATATATSFDRIFVQAGKTATTTLTNAFDDIVRTKTRVQMASYSELQ